MHQVPADLRVAARRFKAGHWLALLTAALLIFGAIAKATGAPPWLVAGLWATMAACAVVGAVWVVPTWLRFRRMAKATDPGRSDNGERARHDP